MQHGARRALTIAIDRIAQQRMAKPMFGMDADLVGAARFRAELDQGIAAALGQLAPVGHGRLALFRGDHPPALFRAGNLAERQGDGTLVLGHRTGDDAQIDLLYLARFEGGVEPLQRLGIAGHQQAARGVGVDPVDRNRHALKAQLQFFQMVFQAAATGAGPLDRQAGGLVDYQGLAIFVQDRDHAHCSASAMRRTASESLASSAAKLMRKPLLPPKDEAGTTATP